jgi:hypothetical protein
MPKEIKDFNEAVYVLGGTTQAARVIGRRPSQIGQWRSRFQAFPAELYLVVNHELGKRGFRAGLQLFTFEPARSRRRSRIAA